MIASAFGILFDGLAYGMLLFLMSVGLSVTLGMMNFVNLAHCAFAMLGGYVTVTLANRFGWPFLATLPMAFIAAALVSVVLERALYRGLYRDSRSRSVLPTGLSGLFADRGLGRWAGLDLGVLRCRRPDRGQRHRREILRAAARRFPDLSRDDVAPDVAAERAVRKAIAM